MLRFVSDTPFLPHPLFLSSQSSDCPVTCNLLNIFLKLLQSGHETFAYDDLYQLALPHECTFREICTLEKLRHVIFKPTSKYDHVIKTRPPTSRIPVPSTPPSPVTEHLVTDDTNVKSISTMNSYNHIPQLIDHNNLSLYREMRVMYLQITEQYGRLHRNEGVMLNYEIARYLMNT